MGAGSSALIWYGLCFIFVAFVGIVSSALILYGQRAESRRRKALEAARPDGAQPTPNEPEPPPALDPGAGDR